MNERNEENREILTEDKEKKVKLSENDKNQKVQEKPSEIKLSVEEKLKASEEKLLRSLAEIENQRRRFDKEIKDAFEFGSFNFAKESLAILDNLERAKEAIKNDEKLKINIDLERFLQNISIIEKDLVSIFEKNRIKKIEVKDRKFDPNFHQAMTEFEDEKTKPGTILQEIQAGYMLGDRLLRPALVSVSKKKSYNDQENNKKKEEK